MRKLNHEEHKEKKGNREYARMNKHFEPLIARWQGEKIECGKGVTEQAIVDFEWKEKVKLSDDVRSYFLATNGMGTSNKYDELFNNFYPLEELVPLDRLSREYNEVVDNANAYYVFADHSIGICYYAVCLQDNLLTFDDVISVHPSHAGLRPAELERQWPCFMDFIQAYIEDPQNIL